MDKRNKQCVHCGDEFEPDKRVRDQKYCGKEDCQRTRRAIWRRGKMMTDPDYRDNQKRCQTEWLEKNKGYYKKYRERHPEKAERNRILQKGRDAIRRKNGLNKLLAKIDAIQDRLSRPCGGIFRIVPQGDELLAKIDAMTVELIPV